jgi:hypothetical protein
MTKSGETKFSSDGREHSRAARAPNTHGPKCPAAPRPKKERPASKGRVHKGRTRN